jgi:hypothetical protein
MDLYNAAGKPDLFRAPLPNTIRPALRSKIWSKKTY